MNGTLKETAGAALRGLSMSCVLAALWGCTANLEGGPNPGAGATAGTGSSGGGSGGATGGATNTNGTPLEVKLSGQPVFSRFVRLTNDQWENAVRDVLHLQAA